MTTAQTDLTGITAVWDAATKIPSTDNSYTGCGSAAFGAGTGGCRTIFTHTQAGAVPPRVVIDQTAASNSTLLGLFNTNGGTLSHSYLQSVASIVEVVRQLRHEAPANQVKDAEVGLVSGMGPGDNCVLLLGRG